MNDPNQRTDSSNALPAPEPAPPPKRRCPSCGGEDVMKLFCRRRQTRDFEYGGLGLGYDLSGYGGDWVGFELMDLETGQRLGGNKFLHPNLRVCLSCGFMAWYVARDARDWLRDERDRVLEDAK